MGRQKGIRARRGFTLIEVLAVVVIMAILAGGVFMMLGAGNDQANIAKTTAQIHAIASLLEDYRNCYGAYPRVTNPDDDGYAPLNFTFKIEDGGTCEECGNSRGRDGVAFGLVSHFIPRASKMYEKAADTNMASHYEDCFSDPSGQDDNPAWERELGNRSSDWSEAQSLEAADSNLNRINRVWRRLAADGMVYETETFCNYCGTRTYAAGAQRDAWDKELKYNVATGAIVSAGPDGVFGTGDDITGAGTGTDEDED